MACCRGERTRRVCARVLVAGSAISCHRSLCLDDANITACAFNHVTELVNCSDLGDAFSDDENATACVKYSVTGESSRRLEGSAIILSHWCRSITAATSGVVEKRKKTRMLRFIFCEYGAAPEGRGAGETGDPREKPRRTTASSGTIPACENGVTRPGTEPGPPWREASVLVAQPEKQRDAAAHECGALSLWCNSPDLVKLSLHEAEEYHGSRTLAVFKDCGVAGAVYRRISGEAFSPCESLEVKTCFLFRSNATLDLGGRLREAMHYAGGVNETVLNTHLCHSDACNAAAKIGWSTTALLASVLGAVASRLVRR
ncbi:hypothetical protein PR048_029350 [Dryococelus australis]|uniref:Uncharacterized protein n=1 Tax=Dryococelus australis TaxID=614101 RepID=A0ABQ9GG28_9NEOP|nr:hypothetical protein PR048_029350 [Dryococelus australis]